VTSETFEVAVKYLTGRRPPMDNLPDKTKHKRVSQLIVSYD
jgi:hypothetical protein